MKKTTLVIAVAAGLTGLAAHAQSNVTLYGVVDNGFGYSKTTGSKATTGVDAGVSAGSRWGLRGSEDLGGGLKANFQLESGINSDVGTSGQSNRLFGRQSWIGLSGGFGEVRIGRQDSFGFNWAGSISPFGNSFKQAQRDTIFGYKNVGDRLDNSLSYTTPSMGGFQAGLAYSLQPDGQETAGNDNDTPVVSLGLRYKNGPLLAVATYEIKQDADVNNGKAGRGDIKNLEVGATYEIDFVTLAASYGQLKNRGFSTSAKSENAYLIGATFKLGNAGSVLVDYQRVSKRNLNQLKIDSTRDGFALAYIYPFSKRTSLYVYGSQYNDVAVRADDPTRLADTREFGLGFRHNF